RVDGAGLRLRMELHGKKWALSVPHSLVCPIIGIEKPRLPARRQSLIVHRIAVVLRRDVTSLRPHLDAGLILATMPVLQFERVGTRRQTKQLVSQTNPQDRPGSLQPPTNDVKSRQAFLRISWTVRPHAPIRLFMGPVMVPRTPQYIEAALMKRPQNPQLAAEIHQNDSLSSPAGEQLDPFLAHLVCNV